MDQASGRRPAPCYAPGRLGWYDAAAAERGGQMDISSDHASVVSCRAKFTSSQGSDYSPGISAETVRSQGLFLAR
jgi:hypothetical protein